MAKKLEKKPAAKKAKRNPPYVILVGKNGTGKSTKMRKLMGLNQRNLIIPSNIDDSMDTWGDIKTVLDVKQDFYTVKTGSGDDDKKEVPFYYIPGINTFKGNAKIHFDDHDIAPVDLFKAVLHRNKGFRNGGLFMDDCKNYIHSRGNLPHWISNVFRNRRHKNISLFLAVHDYSDVNHDFLSFGPTIAVCATAKQPSKTFQSKVPPEHLDGFLKVVTHVRHEARKNPYYCSKIDFS